MWHAHFKEKEVVLDSPQSSLLYAKPMIFPNIRKTLIHIMVLPVTSCEAERSFSTLRRIKSYLRTTMTNERLNGLALVSVYNDTSYIPTTAELRAEWNQHCFYFLYSAPTYKHNRYVSIVNMLSKT